MFKDMADLVEKLSTPPPPENWSDVLVFYAASWLSEWYPEYQLVSRSYVASVSQPAHGNEPYQILIHLIDGKTVSIFDLDAINQIRKIMGEPELRWP